MDDLDLIRAARPPGSYPEDRRAATRAAVLAGMAKLTQQRAVRPGNRRRRLAGCWRAGLVAALTASAAMTVVAVHAAGPPPSAHSSPPAPAGSVGHVLELAARSTVTPPPGTRWIVTENQVTSTAWHAPDCGGTVQEVNGLAHGKLLPISSACPATPPATLPRYRGIWLEGGGPPGYPAWLPGQPRLLLTDLYRWLRAGSGAGPPGMMAPGGSASVRDMEAFDALVRMITQGSGTTPGKGVLLAAVGLIPGVKIAHFRTSPDIGVMISVPGWQETMIMNAQNYKIIGDRTTSVLPSGKLITVNDILLWQAYYDASGHRL